MAVSDKARLRSQLQAQLAQALVTAQAAHAAAVEGATHSEARAENDKDTRGLEQSYLARGQAQRVAELEAAVGEVGAMKLRAFGAKDPIALGALVTVEEGGERRRYFVAPSGGGGMLDGDIQVITPASPVGHVLLGKYGGDEVELRLGGRTRELEIIDVD